MTKEEYLRDLHENEKDLAWHCTYGSAINPESISKMVWALNMVSKQDEYNLTYVDMEEIAIEALAATKI